MRKTISKIIISAIAFLLPTACIFANDDSAAVSLESGALAVYSTPAVVNSGSEFTNSLYITPQGEIPYNPENNSTASMTVTLENGIFPEDVAQTEQYVGPPFYNYTYDDFMEEILRCDQDVLWAYMNCGMVTNYIKRSDLPYKLERISDKTIKIYLAPLPEKAVNEDGIITPGKPFYKIPIRAVANSGKVNIKTQSDIDWLNTADDLTVASTVSFKADVAKKTAYINKVVPVEAGQSIDGLTLSIYPASEIDYSETSEDDRSMIITVKNGKFSSDAENAGKYAGPSSSGDPITYEDFILALNEYDRIITAYSGVGIATNFAKRSDLPYKFVKLNDTQAKIVFAPIPAEAVNESDVITPGKPYFSIPLPIVADGNDNVSIEANFISNSFRGNTYEAYVAYPSGSPRVYNKNARIRVSYETADSYSADAAFNGNLIIRPLNEVPYPTSFIVTLDNGKFDDDIEQLSFYSIEGSPEPITYNSLEEAIFDLNTIRTAYEYIGMRNNRTYTSALPYKIERLGDDRLKIYAAPIPNGAANESGVITPGTPYYSIPLYFKAGSRDMHITTDCDLTDFQVEKLLIASIQGSANEEEFIFGGAEADKELTASDAADIMQKVLNYDSYKMPIEYKTDNYMKYIDVDMDGHITATDASLVLQKVLNSEMTLPAEKAFNQ